MSGVIIWMGPVSTANLASVKLPPDWSVVTISAEVVQPGSSALTPTMFRTYAATLGADPLGALMARAKTSPDEAILASFSAGHGLLDPLLQANGGDPRIRGVYAADSVYGLDVKAGYLKQGKASVATGTPFWLSTSSAKGGVTIHSGSESMIPLAQALGLQDMDPPAGMPTPVLCKGLGGCVWLDYQSLFSHGDHATKLAPAALDIWFGAAPPTLPSGGGPGLEPGLGSKALGLGAGALAGFLAARWAGLKI